MAKKKNEQEIEEIVETTTPKETPVSKTKSEMAKLEIRDKNARLRVKKKRGGHMLITIDQLDNPHITKQLSDAHLKILKEGKGISQRRK